MTYLSVCLVGLDVQHATCVRRIVIYGLSGSKYFPNYSQKGRDFWKKVIEHKMFVRKIIIVGRIQRYIVIRISMYMYCCEILMELEFSQWTFEKYSSMKFHENASSGSTVLPY